jgi:HPt (histidine-containing phosphotransfer) domain-containing protein
MQKNYFNKKLNYLYELFSNDSGEINAVLTTITAQINDFRASLKTDSPDTLRFKAHKIKGELGTLGFTELSAAVAEIETNLVNGSFQPAQTGKFDDIAGNLLEDIKTWLLDFKRSAEH